MSKNNFACWKCNESHFYSDDYRKKNVLCEECKEAKLNWFWKLLIKLK
jgi:hypothetical protein